MILLQLGELMGNGVIRLDIIVSQMTGKDSGDGGMLIKLVFYVAVHDLLGFPSSPQELGSRKGRILVVIAVASHHLF